MTPVVVVPVAVAAVLVVVPVAVVVGWVAVFLVVHSAILLAGVAARRAGKDPRLHGADGWPAVTNLRKVDATLLVGGQPSGDEYRHLAARGVTRVVDVRTGRPTDPRRDEPDALAALGVEYVSLPIRDGWSPTPAQVRQFLRLVDEAGGVVFEHCGGGVGRTTSLAAAYESAHGREPSVLQQLATGPPTLEQIWFVATRHPGEPDRPISRLVTAASRLIDIPRHLYGRLKPRGISPA